MSGFVIFLTIIISIIINFVGLSCESSFASCLTWNNRNISQFLSIVSSCGQVDLSCYIRECFLNDGFGIFMLLAFSFACLLLVLMVCVICIGFLCVCISCCVLPRNRSALSPVISRYSRRRKDVSFQNSHLTDQFGNHSLLMSEASYGRDKSNHSASIMYESFHLDAHTHVLSNTSTDGYQEVVKPKNSTPKPSHQTEFPNSTNKTGLILGNETTDICGSGLDQDSVIYEEVFSIYDAFEKGRDLNEENDSMSQIALNSNVVKDWKTATIVLSTSERKKIGDDYNCVFGQAPTPSLGEVKYFRRESQFMNPSTDISKIYDDMSDLKIREINRKTLTFDTTLGHGNFAIVYKGVWASNYGDIPVAVKVLNENNQPEQLVGVLREAAAMAQFDHPNVLKLFGVVTLGMPCVIVSELLKDQLVYFLYKLNRSPIPKSKFPSLLLKFCTDICQGMEYLAGLKFVHRDLSARNVLVTVNLTCRIADFGMCREMKTEQDYYKASAGCIPVRWTAPESILHQRYSEKSDVWSFGMTMYEIWTLGMKPWHNLEIEDVIEILLKHTLLSPPTGCPRNVYELMIDIWNQDPEHRPFFRGVKDKLKSIKLSSPASTDPALIPGNDPKLAKDLYLDLQNKYAHD